MYRFKKIDCLIYFLVPLQVGNGPRDSNFIFTERAQKNTCSLAVLLPAFVFKSPCHNQRSNIKLIKNHGFQE